MENELEVQLLNVVKYKTKDNRDRTILRFISLDKDKMVNNDKFKGITIIDMYYDGYDVFDKIPFDLVGKRVTVTTEVISNISNPLLQTLKVIKINDISLA